MKTYLYLNSKNMQRYKAKGYITLSSREILKNMQLVGKAISLFVSVLIY